MAKTKKEGVKQYKVTNHFVDSEDETIQRIQEKFTNIIGESFLKGTLYEKNTEEWKKNQIAIGKL